MILLQKSTQVPVTHIGRSHPAKTSNGSDPLIVKLKTLYTKPTSHARNEPMARTFI